VILVCAAFTVYFYILIARIVLSWVTAFSSWTPPPAVAPLVGVVYEVTEPVMGFFRRYIPPIGGLDLSPIVLFFVLSLVRNAVGC
jgi:YggT family protein